MPVTSCHGIWPRKVPRGGGSCHKSPEKITLSPPKGATQWSPFFAYFVADRSMMSWRQRASRRASISALTMLISSMSNQRHFTASFAKSNMRCASMLWSFPCHANPNALWIVSPFSVHRLECDDLEFNTLPPAQAIFEQFAAQQIQNIGFPCAGSTV